jgi:hypothetical protein
MATESNTYVVPTIDTNTVGIQQRSRPSIMDDPQFTTTTTTSRISWSEAFNNANELCEQEHDRKQHPKYLYLGTNCCDRFLFRHAFAPGKILKVFNRVGLIAMIPLSVMCVRILGLSAFSQIGFGLSIFNFLSKALCIGNLFEKHDSIVYQLPRMMDEKLRKSVMKKSGFFNCGSWLSVMMLVLFPLNAVSPFAALAIYVLDASRDSLTVTEICVFTASYIFMPAMIRAFVTWNFIGLARGLSVMIDEYEMITYIQDGNSGKEKKRKVDWKKTFENYQLLANTVENFSAGYALYFFVAEFVLFIAYICVSIGMVTEWYNLDGSVVQLIRAASMSCFSALYTMILFELVASAASITGKAKRLKQKAHRLCAQVEWDDPDSLPAAHRFYEHIERAENSLGFKSMGILISPSLFAKIAYTFSSLASAAIFYLVRERDRRE